MIRRLAGHAGSVRMLRPGVDVPDAPPLAARGRYQRENLALALVACELLLGDAFDRPRALAAAAHVVVPGRLQAIGTDPLVLVDGAHNPHGARALAAELPAAIGSRRPLVGVIAILADKDVDGVLDVLAPSLQAARRDAVGVDRGRCRPPIWRRGSSRAACPRRPSCRRRRRSRGRASRPGRRAPSSSAGRCRCSRSWRRCWSGPRRRASMARKAGGLGVVAFALAIILTVVLLSYAVGYLIGRILL